MTAILRRELRRLLPLCGVLLAAAALAGLVDLSANRSRSDPMPIALWFGWFLVGLTAVGGGLLAQTGASPELRFLALWPVRRRAVWLARVPLHLLLSSLTAVGIVIVVVGLPSLGGHDFWLDILGGPAGNDRTLLLVLPSLFLLSFSLAALWSQIAGAGWSVLLTALALCGWVATFSAGGHWVSLHLGPWLRLPLTTGDVSETALTWCLLLPAVALLLAAAGIFLRLPLLEARRRTGMTLVALPVAFALAAVVGLGLLLDTGPRPPVNLEWAEVTADGRYVAVQGRSSGTGEAAYTLWAVDAATGQSRLACRNGLLNGALSGHWAALTVFTNSWLLDLESGALRHVPLLRWPGTAVSPGGRYHVVSGEEPTIRGRGGVELELPAAAVVVGWEPDESAAFVARRSVPGAAAAGEGTTLVRVQLPGGGQQVLGSMPAPVSVGTLGSREVFVGAGLIAVSAAASDGGAGPLVQVLDTRTGRNWQVAGGEAVQGVAGGRYLWVRSRRGGSSHGVDLTVADSSTAGATSTAIASERLRGQRAWRAVISPDGSTVYFVSSPPLRRAGQPHLWTSDPAGRHLRDLGVLPRNLYLAGVSAGGALIASDDGNLVAIDPRTHQERVLMAFAEGHEQGTTVP